MDSTSLFGAITQGGAFAVLAFVVWHATTRGLPRLLTAFERQGEAQRTTFTETLSGIRADFAREMRAEREAHDRTLARLIDAGKPCAARAQQNGKPA